MLISEIESPFGWSSALAAMPPSLLLVTTVSLTALCLLPTVTALEPRDVVVVVLSQEGPYDEKQAQRLKADLHRQARAVSENVPVIHLIHEEFSHPGAWTVIPILPKLSALHGFNSSWIFFCEPFTKINLNKVIQILEKYNSDEEVWIGHSVYDREASIIHHYAFIRDPQKFKYPCFASGFALSTTLVKQLSTQIIKYNSTSDFSIDPAHELALFVWNGDTGPRITHVPQLCLEKNRNCASYPLPFQPCGDPLDRESIYFAVKTCGKFHKDRVPMVKKTWGKYVTNIGFYSEVEDNSIPTIHSGIPNTRIGHCEKTFAIMNHITSLIKDHPGIKWIAVVDDDTILSVARLLEVLSCYDSNSMLAIGERYGYNVRHSDKGYNYLAGGAGMLFTSNLLIKILNSKQCKCPTADTPDDMYLGICLASLNVPITHSPLFHQARLEDYAPEYILPQVPVTFHKHWMIDPLKFYNEWFAEEDGKFDEHIQTKHIEL